MLVGIAELVGIFPDVGADGVHENIALDGLEEGRCLARHVQSQGIGAADVPTLPCEVVLGFGIERADRVVVLQGHRLAAAVDDGLLGKRSLQIADGGTGLVNPAIQPGIVDAIAFVVVAFEVLHDEELLG